MNLSKKIKLNKYVLFFSFINLILYHIPFYNFVFKNFDIKSSIGILLIISLTIAALFLNALFFYLILYLFRKVGKWLLVLFFIINSIALYFINTYGVIIDESMIGNVLNTNYEESSSFFSLGLLIYILFLGLTPSFLLIKLKYNRPNLKKFFIHVFLSLIILLSIAYINSSNWLWVDKNSKTLGGLVMPWSYTVNLTLYQLHKNKENKKEITLPKAHLKNNETAVVVLVIGESARSANFSLYGYDKNTNPLLSKMNDVHHFKAQSCATYTRAGVKCILDYKETSKLYEILPNYLYNNNVDVIWRTSNWGEPKVHIKQYQDRAYLKKICKENCTYDQVLLTNLKEQITNSKKNKILVILHTSTSHGPTYSKKYPPEFEKFTPVCNSVELAKCTTEELINAYDNTIVYTDFLLASIINDLKQLNNYKSSMIFVSDHGESLGETNLYMHGIPKSIAPDEQLDIPFIVWTSDQTKKMKPLEQVSQHFVFHSVLNLLDIESPIYNEKLSIFK
ncbi:MAG: phosphoethanolamine--lipid A transferase EptA [Flavobacteriales bacterium]